jgi:hypothetical protein
VDCSRFRRILKSLESARESRVTTTNQAPTPIHTAILCIALASFVLTTSATQAEIASSASFVIQQSTLGTAEQPSSSGSYVITASKAQPATIGSSSSPHYIVQSGFWSFIAQGLVPVVVTVDRGSSPPEVNLQWSGNQDPFQVYQSTDCTGVFFAPATQTSSNQLLDVDTVPGLTCFNVLATAPGPAPPP